jgi:hypothetical protein
MRSSASRSTTFLRAFCVNLFTTGKTVHTYDESEGSLVMGASRRPSAAEHRLLGGGVTGIVEFLAVEFLAVEPH